MNAPNESIKESEFVFRRLGESFTQFVGDLWQSVPLWLLIPVVLVVLVRIGYGRYYRKTHGAAKPDATLYWLRWAAVAAVTLLVGWVLVSFYKSDTDTTHAGSATLSALAESNETMWYTFVAALFGVGALFVILMYIKDARSVRWYWAVMLAALRITVYAVLCFVFLLPATQTWERTEKRSRVVVLIDVTPSMTRVSDEITKKSTKPKKRMELLLEFLQDRDIALIANLLKNNPVAIYAFGTRLDENPSMIERGGAPWGANDWDAFVNFDFRPFLLKGISAKGQEALQNTMSPPELAWSGPKMASKTDKPEPANWADWAAAWYVHKDDKNIAQVVPGMNEADAIIFKENLTKLERRIDVARSIALGTNVPDSITAAVNREAPNMVQGIVVFSDMRSNLGSNASIRELRDRASKEKIPIFTVAVGDNLQSTSIVITDVQADDINSPDEPFKVSVEADGYGLADLPVNVELDLYGPGMDPKTHEPAYTMRDSRKDKSVGSPTPYTLTFAAGDPPHGQVEFVIDPARLAVDPDPKARALVVESTSGAFKKPVLKEGKWSVRARIPKDDKEAFLDEEHVRERLGIQVIQKKIRVLVVAGAPSREFQFIRTFLTREVQENRATVTLLLQNEAGLSGNLTPNPTEQIIRRFPSRLDLSGKIIDPAEKPYNFNEYDLIIAFDPDWTEISQQQAEDMKLWIERQGGGFILVADRINSFQLARTERDNKDARLLPILEVLPVIPDDPIAIIAKQPPPRTPRRLYLHPMLESDLLKIDDPPDAPKKEGMQPDDNPVAGWEQFFTDREKYVENRDDKIELFPRRGFYSSYPVKEVKAGSHVLADFVDEDFNHVKTLRPWIVLSNPIAGFRTCFMASGELYRMYAYDKTYYERFWAKMMKYMAGKRNVKAARGRILVSKEVISGQPIRVNAQILGTNSKPYPDGAITPKFNVVRTAPNGEKKTIGPTEMKPTGVDGYFKGQITADPKDFPTGDFEYSVVIEVPDSAGETLQGKFQIVRSDLEMDVTKPDFAANLAMASDFDEAIAARVSDDVKKKLIKGLPNDNGVPKLAFKLGERELLKLIPECCPERTPDRQDIRGPVHDLWDKGIEMCWDKRMPGWLHKSLEADVNAARDSLRDRDPNENRKSLDALAQLDAELKSEKPFDFSNVKLDDLSGLLSVKSRVGIAAIRTSWVMMAVIFLLCLEWLTRKLLRLA